MRRLKQSNKLHKSLDTIWKLMDLFDVCIYVEGPNIVIQHEGNTYYLQDREDDQVLPSFPPTFDYNIVVKD